MTEPLGPVTTTSSNLTPLYFRGEGGCQHSHSAAAKATDVAASTTTFIPGDGHQE